jgi:hypothetical protein
VVCNSSKTERKEGGQQGGGPAGLLIKICQKICQNVIFEVMSEVQKDQEEVFAEIDINRRNKLLNTFSCYLRSNSARSTLTSPSPIKVNGIGEIYP